MSLIFSMINESNKRMMELANKENNYDPTRIANAQREFESQIALIDVIVHAYGIASKNKRARVNQEDREIDNTVAIVFDNKDRGD